MLPSKSGQKRKSLAWVSPVWMTPACAMTGMVTLQSIQLEHKYLKDLIPADYNPRKDLKPGDKEYESLKRSIEQYGIVEPIIWNRATGHIVGGHQRLKVLLNSGETETDCVVVDLDENDEKGLNIALNKISGDWDLEKLDKLIEDLKAVNFDISLTGFSPEELDKMLREVMKDSQDDEFDVEAELSKPAFSKMGDIWLLGKHKVICGDSTLPDTYKRLMGDVKANLLCTDPPYFVDLTTVSGKIKNDDLEGKEAYDFLMKAFTCFKNALADDASTYVFYASSKSRIFYDAYEDSGFRVSCGLIWKKEGFVFSRTDWKHIFEPIIFGWKKDGRHRWYGDQKQATCFEFPSIKSSKVDGFGHPSSKPVPLLAYLIQQSTMTNGVVLDGFLGSASTLIACEQLNRICYGVELEPKFVDVACQRYRQYSMESGRTGKPGADIFLIRDGQRLTYDEVMLSAKRGD